MEWFPSGEIDVEARPLGLPFGYLDVRRFTTIGDVHDVLTVRFSTDFREWHQTVLAEVITPCPGWEPRGDSYDWGTLIGDDHVLQLTMESDPDQAVCAADNMREVYRPVGWTTRDGVDWTRTVLDWPLDSAFREGANIAGGWPVDGGWEVVVHSRWEPSTMVVRSTDGAAWHEIARIEHDAEAHERIISTVASADGTRVIAITTEDPFSGQTTLRVLGSSNGEDWSEIVAPFTGTHPPGPDGGDWLRALAPRSPVDAWVFVVEHADCFATARRATVWVSSDLAQWDSAEFPWIVPRTELIASTPYGLIAHGGGYCDVTGGEGPPTPKGDRLLLSRDGLTWTPVRPAELHDGILHVIEGPEGVLLVEWPGQMWATR